MEFEFDIKEILPNSVTVVESKDSDSILYVYSLNISESICEDRNWICNLSSNIIWDPALRKKKENLETLIDRMGIASSRAQDLVLPITSFRKLLNSSQQKLYIVRDIKVPFAVIGILKIGQKRLFISDDSNAQHEVDAACVLDFYIHESRQRSGYGHELFELMLKNENVEPPKLAIDRPSFKFISFLSKHYELNDPKPQANNFVVFAGFLDRTDLKPPIFLYDNKGSYNNSSSKSKKCANDNIKKSLDALQTVPVHLSKDRKCSCAGKCHHKNETSPNLDSFFKKRRTASSYIVKEASSPYSSEKRWSVYDALHSYSENNNLSNGGSNTCSSPCSLTPVDNSTECAEKEWRQHQSSWNIFGVRPPCYPTQSKES